MENNELIYDFLDGEISSTSEDALFSELAHNRELRTDFKQAVDVRTTLSSYPEMFVPAPESTNRIFAAIGFAAPGFVGGVAGRGLSAWFSNNSTLILSSLASAALSCIITILLLNNNATNQEPIFANVQNEKDAVVNFLNQSGLYNQSSPAFTYQDPIKEKVVYKEKTVFKYVYKEREVDNNFTEIPIEHNEIFANEVAEYLDVEIEPIEASTPKFENRDFKYLANAFNPDIREDYKYDLTSELSFGDFYESIFDNIYVEFRSMQTSNMPKETFVTNNQVSPFNNLIGGLFILLDDNIEAGVDLRQETFYLQYETTNTLGIIRRFADQPNFTTVSASFKYRFKTDYNLFPYLAILGGANDLGWVYRGGAGLDYYFDNNLGISLGLEYSSLNFQYQGKTYESPKMGVIYGLKWKL